MSEVKERDLFVPNTAVEALAMMEAEFPDTIQREPLATLWDYGHETGIQIAIDFLRKAVNAEAINEEDENMLHERGGQD